MKVVKSRYGQAAQLSASFVQTGVNRMMGTELKTEGKVYFKRPNRLRFDYLTEPKKSIVSDGQTLWMVWPDDKKYYSSTLPKDQGSEIPMKILAGNLDLSNNYEAEITGMDKDAAMLTLRPKTDRATYRQVVLYIDSKSGELQKSVVTDVYGNDVVLTFSDIDTQTKIKDSLFGFKPGPGYKEMGEQGF